MPKSTFTPTFTTGDQDLLDAGMSEPEIAGAGSGGNPFAGLKDGDPTGGTYKDGKSRKGPVRMFPGDKGGKDTGGKGGKYSGFRDWKTETPAMPDGARINTPFPK